MICVLQCTNPGLTTFLDPGPDIYLAAVVGAGPGIPVSCMVYAVDGPGFTPNQVVVTGTLPQLMINNTAVAFSNLPATGNPMRLNFTVGDKPTIERTNSWNAINITVQDRTGDQTNFNTIWYFLSAAGGGGTTTTTPIPTTTSHPLMRPAKKKARR